MLKGLWTASGQRFSLLHLLGGHTRRYLRQRPFSQLRPLWQTLWSCTSTLTFYTVSTLYRIPSVTWYTWFSAGSPKYSLSSTFYKVFPKSWLHSLLYLILFSQLPLHGALCAIPYSLYALPSSRYPSQGTLYTVTSAKYPLYRILLAVPSTRYYLHSALNMRLSIDNRYSVPSIQNPLRSTLCTISSTECPLYIMISTLYSVPSTWYHLHICNLYTLVLSSILHVTLHCTRWYPLAATL